MRAFGRRLRKLLRSGEADAILEPWLWPEPPPPEALWTEGGCWILAEALCRVLGPPARLVGVWAPYPRPYVGEALVHAVVEIDGWFLDSKGAHTEGELVRLWSTTGEPKAALVPFSTRAAEGIRCPAVQVERLEQWLARHLQRAWRIVHHGPSR